MCDHRKKCILSLKKKVTCFGILWGVWFGFVEWIVRQVLVASVFGWVRLGKVGLGGLF